MFHHPAPLFAVRCRSATKTAVYQQMGQLVWHHFIDKRLLIFAGFGLWALAIAQIAAPAAACVAAFWGARWLPGFRIKLSSLRELLHYGIFASGNRFLQTMNLDQLIIGTLVSPAALGIYNVARRLYEMLNNVVAGGLNSVSHVLLSSLQHDKDKVREAFLMATFGCSLVSFPAFMGLAAVADDAIPLIFGPHWAAAIWPVPRRRPTTIRDPARTAPFDPRQYWPCAVC